MVTDGRVKELRRLLGMGRTLADSARMAEISEQTGRKYRDSDVLPSQKKTARTYRTRTDPFEDVWAEVQERLETEPKLKAKTLFRPNTTASGRVTQVASSDPACSDS